MGQEISTDHFTKEDFDRFRNRLKSEMELLRSWFAGNRFVDDRLQCGLELEAWLVGQDGLPAPENSLFLTTVDRDCVVPELSKFNFELNVSPQYIVGDGLGVMQSELRETWTRCESVAQRLGYKAVSIGILPTVTDDMLCLQNMSTLQRYAAINEQVLRLREGRPLTLKIDGQDRLVSTHHDVMLESAATSIQVHLKVPPQLSVRYYNASIIASALTVAMAANAPLLFGRRLWMDTRVTLFEQAVDTAGHDKRVSFGSKYVEDSLLELFENNLHWHRILLPAELEETPASMPHVRMHNGTIWNWNRPLIGFESDGRPHLRIEHRPMSASPSMADLFADTSLYLGLTHFLANLSPAPESLIDFATARDNFYKAAQFGFDAELVWLDGNEYPLAKLLERQLLPHALEAMSDLGIEPKLIRSNEVIIRGRIDTRQNGAAWQLRKFADYDGNLSELLQSYARCQETGAPVHTWK